MHSLFLVEMNNLVNSELFQFNRIQFYPNYMTKKNFFIK